MACLDFYLLININLPGKNFFLRLVQGLEISRALSLKCLFFRMLHSTILHYLYATWLHCAQGDVHSILHTAPNICAALYTISHFWFLATMGFCTPYCTPLCLKAWYSTQYTLSTTLLFIDTQHCAIHIYTELGCALYAFIFAFILYTIMYKINLSICLFSHLHSSPQFRWAHFC